MCPRTHRHGRDYYLSDLPLEEAWNRFHALLDRSRIGCLTAAETVSLDRARGRVTAEPVWAAVSSPHYDAAAMDGVAVKSHDTVGATESSPLLLSPPDQVRWVDTGDPMPDGFDAVIMVEQVHETDDGSVEIRAPAPPYNHVRPIGEDIVATELVLPVNHVLRPVDLGACAAAGLTEVSVRGRPVVTIIPTGTELVPIGSELNPGVIVEFNSLIIAGMVEEWGGVTKVKDPVLDDLESIRNAASEAASQSDIVLINAGSSAGSEDHTAKVVEELGELAVHGVAIRPGHPVVLGIVGNRPAVGIPGYPVSAALACELFVKPLIEKALGIEIPARTVATGTMARSVHSPLGEDEYLRVKMGRVRDRMVATPIQRGAGVIMSLVRADGLVKIPRFSEGVAAGASVSVDLFRPVEEIERTIIATGSHDLVLDLLASELNRTGQGVSLASSNVGSLGGLRAIDRGEAHLAGTHLLDEESGLYNVPFIQRHVQDQAVVLVNLVHRVQGFIVPRGNPAGMQALSELTREGVVFVNRQRGSGTRVLLDYKLATAGIDSQDIAGYQREEYTHLAVAAAVAGGKANVGLGILSAARAIGLDFIPLFDERYDLAIPADHYESDLLAPLLELIGSTEFRLQVEGLGGYDASQMGAVVARIGSSPK